MTTRGILFAKTQLFKYHLMLKVCIFESMAAMSDRGCGSWLASTAVVWISVQELFTKYGQLYRVTSTFMIESKQPSYVDLVIIAI